MTEARLVESENGGLDPRGRGLVRAEREGCALAQRRAAWRLRAVGVSRGPDFPQLGINLNVMQPGESMTMYHRENAQEDFLVLRGECLLRFVEGEERQLRQWDLFHCPAGVAHAVVGAGDGPSLVLAVGVVAHRLGARRSALSGRPRRRAAQCGCGRGDRFVGRGLQAVHVRMGPVPERLAAGVSWFVRNIRDVQWFDGGRFGVYGDFQGGVHFDEFGFNFGVVWPGQPVAMYHREDHQEGFLVLSGECLLIVEGRSGRSSSGTTSIARPGSSTSSSGRGTARRS